MTIHWFAIYTHPLREMSARDELQADEHPMRAHLQVFLPYFVRRLVGHRPGRGSPVKRALLPCYLLARFDPDSAPWRTINGTRGVVRIICQGDIPCPVSDGQVADLQAKTDQDGKAEIDDFPKYYVNQLLHVRDGVWAGRSALFVAGAGGLLTLAVDILGRSVKVSVPEDQVEA